jgi:hypothetical protein
VNDASDDRAADRASGGGQAGPVPDRLGSGIPGRPGAGGRPPGRHQRAREQRSSYREVFAIAEFRALWTAQVLSFAGDQFAQVAIAILVYRQTHSAF